MRAVVVVEEDMWDIRGRIQVEDGLLLEYMRR